MRITLSVQFDIERAKPEPPPQPEGPVLYDVSSGHIERAQQWDHDKREPIGFTGKEASE